MKMYLMKRVAITAAALVWMAGAATTAPAQQRQGGGGGFGGFGGFNPANRGGSATTTQPYNNNGAVGSAVISVDPQTHNIIVIADEETSQQISNVIASLDTPMPQVLIKVVFMEVQRNNSTDIGIEGGWAKNNIGNAMSSSAGNVFGLSGLNSLVTNYNALGQPISTALSSGTGSSGLGTFYQIVGTDFQATLRAIAQSGKAQVLSRPSILARDGQLAKIVVGQKVPLPTSVSYNTGGNATTIPIVNVTYTDVGIILNVTPFVGANGLVQMIIQPQTSSVNPTKSQTIAPGVSAPYLDVRSADTVVVTPDGQTVVIGGLISNTKSSSASKVPLLGDIPLLGALFRSSEKTDDKTELLIFLTPHIVQSPMQLAALAVKETRQTQILTNTITESELDRFLERIPVKKH
jgi:general secretion pathway protein D